MAIDHVLLYIMQMHSCIDHVILYLDTTDEDEDRDYYSDDWFDYLTDCAWDSIGLSLAAKLTVCISYL